MDILTLEEIPAESSTIDTLIGCFEEAGKSWSLLEVPAVR